MAAEQAAQRPRSTPAGPRPSRLRQRAARTARAAARSAGQCSPSPQFQLLQRLLRQPCARRRPQRFGLPLPPAAPCRWLRLSGFHPARDTQSSAPTECGSPVKPQVQLPRDTATAIEVDIPPTIRLSSEGRESRTAAANPQHAARTFTGASRCPRCPPPAPATAAHAGQPSRPPVSLVVVAQAAASLPS